MLRFDFGFCGPGRPLAFWVPGRERRARCRQGNAPPPPIAAPPPLKEGVRDGAAMVYGGAFGPPPFFSLLFCFFSWDDVGSMRGGGRIGAMIWRRPLSPQTFFLMREHRRGPKAPDVVPRGPTPSGITWESRSGERNGGGSVNPVQRRARKRALRWTLHAVYRRRERRRRRLRRRRRSGLDHLPRSRRVPSLP